MPIPKDAGVRKALLEPLKKWIQGINKGNIEHVHLDIIRCRLNPEYRRKQSNRQVWVEVEKQGDEYLLKCDDFAPYYSLEATSDNLYDGYAMLSDSYRRAMWLMSDKCVPEDFFELYTLILIDKQTKYCQYRDEGIRPSDTIFMGRNTHF